LTNRFTKQTAKIIHAQWIADLLPESAFPILPLFFLKMDKDYAASTGTDKHCFITVEVYEEGYVVSMKYRPTKYEVWCRCLSGVNGVYYGLKSSIFFDVDDLFSTGRYIFFISTLKPDEPKKGGSPFSLFGFIRNICASINNFK